MPQHAWPATEPTEVALTAGDARAGRRPPRRRPARADRSGAGTCSTATPRATVPSRPPRRRAAALAEPDPRRAVDLAGPRAPAGRRLGEQADRDPRPGLRAALAGARRARPTASRSAPSSSRAPAIRSAWPPRSTTCSTPDRLESTVRVRNVGDEPAPFGVGLHPYLAVGATEDGDIGEAELELPARTLLVVDDGGLPTGERRPFDGAVGPDRRPGLRRPADRPRPRRPTAGPASGCAGRPGRSSSPSTGPGRGCRSTAATPCPWASGGAASPSSR